MATYVDYRYDGFGRRIASRPQGTNTNRTIFVYDGDRVIGELFGSSGTPSAVYTWGPDGLISRRALTGTPQSYWYHYGPQGETRQLTDEAGDVVRTYTYTAYGAPVASTGSVANPFQYGGKYGYYTEGPTGVMLAGHRWYSPYLMRWLSRDPIGYEGGTNLYEYVGGDPVNYVDPLGLWRNPWRIKTKATADAQEKFGGLGGGRNGLGDAYRHCLASCMQARTNSQMEAALFGWANEKWGDFFNRQERGERAMDDFNNKCGRDAARGAKSTQDCRDRCLAMANNGSLQTYEGGSTPNYERPYPF